MRVLFWGTPDFALPSLRALGEEGHAVVAAVTRPDRPAGRGRELQASAVKQAAGAEGIPVLQPETPRDPAFAGSIRALSPHVSVVAAYGALLPAEILDVPPHGSVNVHASLLPELRGAAPINWAIMRGYERTGVTIMRMVEALDAGPILYRASLDIPPAATAGELSGMLAELGAAALVEALAQLEAGTLEPREQDHAAATYAPRLDRASARVDWTRAGIEIERRIRGCDPRPAAWSELDGSPVQLFAARAELAGGEAPGSAADAAPGTVTHASEADGLGVRTVDGILWIGEAKPAGKRRMGAAEWIRGRGVRVGRRFV
ncbi:MAG: methionyl-tRNA formyltransferase [Gemmatimonadota bacterium]